MLYESVYGTSDDHFFMVSDGSRNNYQQVVTTSWSQAQDHGDDGLIDNPFASPDGNIIPHDP